VHDEFRVHVQTRPDQAKKLVRGLEAIERAADADPSQRVAVTHDEGDVFLYADSQTAAERARSEVQQAMTDGGIEGAVTVWRWHPLEDRWEDAAAPLPASEAERAAEHERLQEAEAAESETAGLPEWEVRVTLPTHHEARAFAERLAAEGIPVTRRWRHLMLGAVNEDQARALAERLRSEAPAGSKLEVEGSGQEFWDQLHPYAAFGGIAN
jgi:hypothetical protein